MLFGLSGPSRSGKTTVMKAVAERMGIAWQATSTSKVVQELGIDLAKPMGLRERLSLQAAIFERFIADTQAIVVPTILDRTPLDMLAYTFAEFGMASHEALGEKGMAHAMRYAELCKEDTIRNFQAVFALRPLDTYVEEALKPKANPAYHYHFQLVLEGALSELHGVLPYAVITTAHHPDRVQAICDVIEEQMAARATSVGSFRTQ